MSGFTLYSFIGWENKYLASQNVYRNSTSAVPFSPSFLEIIDTPQDVTCFGFEYDALLSFDMQAVQASDTRIYFRMSSSSGATVKLDGSTDNSSWTTLATYSLPVGGAWTTVGPTSLSGYRYFRLNTTGLTPNTSLSVLSLSDARLNRNTGGSLSYNNLGSDNYRITWAEPFVVFSFWPDGCHAGLLFNCNGSVSGASITVDGGSILPSAAYDCGSNLSPQVVLLTDSCVPFDSNQFMVGYRWDSQARSTIGCPTRIVDFHIDSITGSQNNYVDVAYGYIENFVFNDGSPSGVIAMPNVSADEIITNKHVRDWIQYNGPLPTNAPKYYGTDAQYMKMEGLSMPDGQGAISPVYMHDPRRIGKFKQVARSLSAPDLNSANLIMTERHGAIPRQLQKINCPVNIYEPVGECTDPADFLKGWSDYVLVYENGLVDGNKDGGNRSAWGDADDQLEDSLPMKFDDIYPIGALSFGDQATGIITLEVIDVVYANSNNCASCDDGTQLIYAVTESSGSTPGTAPRLIYSVNGGTSWTQGSIDSLGDTEDPAGIDVVGRYLVVYTRTAGGATTSGYYYSEINQNTGAPGTWTKVTTGFVAGFQIRDMYVLTPREVFFCADDGYIYFSDDITTGVSVRSASAATVADLYRIHGDFQETIVATGIGGVVIVSNNRGQTFSVTTAQPDASATIQALCVVNESLWWVGGANGKLYYTLTGGDVWTEKTFSGSGAGNVRDIVMVTPSVLYFSHDTATPTGRIFSTWDGGKDWTNSSPRILNMPTANRFNRLATPPTDAGVAANNIAVAGLGGNGTDGILLLGVAARI